MRRVGLALLLSLLPAPWSMGQGIDVLHQALVVDASGPALSVTLRADLLAEETVEGLDLLTPGLAIERLTADGATVSWAPHSLEPRYLLRATLPRAYAAGERLALEVELAGVPDCNSRLGAPYQRCFHSPAITVLPPAQPGFAWYLLNPWAEDPFTAEVTVISAAGQVTFAGQGAARAARELGDGRREVHFDAGQPTELLFVYSAAKEVVQTPGAPPVVGLFDTGDAAMQQRVERATRLAAALLRIYGRLFGALPVDEVHLLPVPRTFEAGGMGLFGNTLFGDYVFGSLDYLLEQGVAHELAHSWWAGLASGPAPFYSEAFAEYSAWRALGELQGPAARTAGVRMNATWYMYRRPGGADVAILDPEVGRSPAYVHATYHKGSVVLRGLEERAGQSTMDQALRALVARGLGAMDHAVLAQEIRRAGGPELGEELTRWLTTTGYPRLRVAATRAAAEQVELEVELLDTPALVLPLVVSTRTGSEQRTLELREGAAVYPVSAGQEILGVELDPGWSTLREVRPRGRDLNLDGEEDAADLIALALHVGGFLPDQRRVDGGYDPFFDPDQDRRTDVAEVRALFAR